MWGIFLSRRYDIIRSYVLNVGILPFLLWMVQEIASSVPIDITFMDPGTVEWKNGNSGKEDKPTTSRRMG